MGNWKQKSRRKARKIKRALEMNARFSKDGYTDKQGVFHLFANAPEPKPETWRKAKEIKAPPKATLTKYPAWDYYEKPKPPLAEVEYLYFAYGSNLNLAQFMARCPNSKPVEAFELPDYKLVFKGVADIVKAEGRTVSGALYKITNWCEIALDRYEGFPTLYRKVFQTLEDGRKIMFYVMNRQELGRPGQWYFDTIWYGYQDWDMDQAPLLTALNEQGIKTVEELQPKGYKGGHWGGDDLGWNKPTASGSYGRSEHWRYGWDDTEPDYGSDEYWQGVLDGRYD